MDNHHLRGILLKLESRLSDDDRKRLHFFLGNDVPRRIRDDPSLGGTLSLMESLFDQDKINEEDFTFLINAFDEIQCMDAVRLLRDHMRRIQQSNRLNQSMQSLASVMPPTTIDQSIEVQEEDKYAIKSPLITERNIFDNSIEMTGINNTNISPVTKIVDNQSSQPNRKKNLNGSSMAQKCLLLFVLLLSIIGLGVLTGVIIIRSRQFIKELKMKDKSIFQEQAKNNQTLKRLTDLRIMLNQTERSLHKQEKQNETIQQLHNLRSVDNQKMQQLLEEKTKNDQTIQQLHNLRSFDNQKMQNLTNQLQQLREEQVTNNQTIQKLTSQLQQLWKEQVKNNQTIQQLTIQLQQQLREEQVKNNQTTQRLNDQLQQSLKKQREQNEIVQQLNDQLQQSLNKQREQNETMQQLTNQLKQALEKLILSTETGSTPKLDISNININSKWIQIGITVAGGHGFRSALNELSHSEGLFIDDDQTIYVADTDNDRVVKWKSDATYGQIVAGGNGKGNRNDQLNVPRNVIIDEESDSLIISDYGNRRVVLWPRQNGRRGETIISNIDGWGLAIDSDGYLYVCDKKKNEVRRWKRGDMNGIVVAGGNDGGNRLNQLSSPHNIFVDQEHSVYVSDRDNHRVMKWTKNAIEGIVVAGDQGKGDTLTQLSKPRGITVDHLGTVYVADWDNHRVMRWLEGATQGSIVVGGNGQGKRSNQFNYPTDLSFDRQDNLYVLDSDNHRVQKFHIELNPN